MELELKVKSKCKAIGAWDIFKNLEETMKLLRAFPVDFFCYCITDKASLQNLEPLLDNIDPIEVYIVIRPPSEGFSPPYGLDFDKWAKHIKTIHCSFSNLNGVIIDDFNCASFKHGNNFNVWTQPKILKQLLNTKNILETMKFHLVIYEHSIFDRQNMFIEFIKFMVKTNMLFDDLIVPWKNLWSATGLRKSILHVRNSCPNKRIIGLVYNCRTSWYPFTPFSKVYRNIATLTHELTDSVIFYGFHSNNKLRQETAQLIEKWSRR